MAVQLEYAITEPSDPSNALLRTARWCGGVPLVVGVLTFLAWLPTRAPLFARIGLIDLAVGVVCAIVGLANIAIYAWQAFQFRGPKRWMFLRKAVWVALLILVNFPVAIGIIMAVGILFDGL